MVLADLRKFDDAVQSFDRAAAFAPDNPDVHNSLGSALGMLNRHEPTRMMVRTGKTLERKAPKSATPYAASTLTDSLPRYHTPRRWRVSGYGRQVTGTLL